jgi:hypothetical protein
MRLPTKLGNMVYQYALDIVTVEWIERRKRGWNGRLSSLGIMEQFATSQGCYLLAVRSTTNLRSFAKITALWDSQMTGTICSSWSFQASTEIIYATSGPSFEDASSQMRFSTSGLTTISAKNLGSRVIISQPLELSSGLAKTIHSHPNSARKLVVDGWRYRDLLACLFQGWVSNISSCRDYICNLYEIEWLLRP